jgi:hypothetical protein
MAELEIHHEVEGHSDPTGQRVGILAAALAVLLAIASISSHRAHTAAVVHRTEANDQWTYYQSKKIKSHNLDLGADLISVLGAGHPDAQRKLEGYEKEKKRYDKESKEIQDEARAKERESERAEQQALRYDIGEGLLEIAVVLTSLYFISRKKLFPVIGVAAGMAGAVIAATALFV